MTEAPLPRQLPPIVPITVPLALRDIKGITERNLKRIVRTPQLLFISIVQPTIVLLPFRYVLGGAIAVPGGHYVDFVVPGIFLEAVLIGPVPQQPGRLPRRRRARDPVRVCVQLGLRGVGLAVRDPQTAQMAAILPMFILFFASSALVPVATMPGWLQPFARNQPTSVTIEAVRSLFEGRPVYHPLWQAISWCVGMFVVFFAVSLRLYRSATA